jgi:hypothetical protein
MMMMTTVTGASQQNILNRKNPVLNLTTCGAWILLVPL